MNASAQNLEDAANVASLEHIPHEVKHYLDEIRHKEDRVQELQQQIDSEGARWIRHSLRGISSHDTPSPSPSPSSKNTSNIPYKIQHCYAEIEKLSNEKMALAERISALILRTCNRLDSDLNKVRVLQGETLTTESISTRAMSATPTLSANSLLAGNGQINGHDTTANLSESLRLALTTPSLSAPSLAETRKSAIGASTKRRGRSTASPSIRLPLAGSRSISPAAPPPTKASRSSRLSRQIHPPVDDEDIEMGDDADADGDKDGEEVEDGDDADDDKLYCFCQTSSYGDMIACDNEGGCPYEWFHLSCVGLSKPLPDKWYCSVCSVKMVATTTVNVGRRGRKKAGG